MKRNAMHRICFALLNKRGTIPPLGHRLALNIIAHRSAKTMIGNNDTTTAQTTKHVRSHFGLTGHVLDIERGEPLRNILFSLMTSDEESVSEPGSERWAQHRFDLRRRGVDPGPAKPCGEGSEFWAQDRRRLRSMGVDPGKVKINEDGDQELRIMIWKISGASSKNSKNNKTRNDKSYTFLVFKRQTKTNGKRGIKSKIIRYAAKGRASLTQIPHRLGKNTS